MTPLIWPSIYLYSSPKVFCLQEIQQKVDQKVVVVVVVVVVQVQVQVQD
jgi:hypothetical protein